MNLLIKKRYIKNILNFIKYYLFFSLPLAHHGGHREDPPCKQIRLLPFLKEINDSLGSALVV